MKNAKKKKSSNCGVILNLLFTLYSFFVRKAKNSLTHKFFVSDEKSAEKQKSSFLLTALSSVFPKEKVLKIRRKIAAVLVKAPIIRNSDSILDSFISCRCRDYGVFFLSFGIYSLLGCIVGRYFFSDNVPTLASYVACAVSVFISIPLLKEKRSFGYYANTSAMAGFIIFDVLGARKHEIYPVNAKLAPAGLALLLGMGFGLISFIITPIKMALLLLFIFLSFWILHTPEAGMIVVCLILPFLDLKYTVLILSVTLASYVLKILQLKRTAKFGYTDLWVAVFALVFLTGIPKGANGSITINNVLICTLFICSFFLVKNLISSYEWIKRFFMANIFSLTGVSFISLIQVLSYDSDGIVLSVLSSAKHGISSMFDTPDILAVYILSSIPLLFTMAKKSVSGKEKRTSRFIAFASICTLFFTVSYGGYFSFFITLFIFLLMYSKKTFAFATLSVLPVSAIAAIISQIEGFSIFNAFANSSSVSYAAKEAFASVAAYPLCGTGLKEIQSTFTPFYLCITSQLGIPCLVVFMIIIFEFCKSTVSSVYSDKANTASAKYAYFAAAPAVSVMSILLLGFFSSAPMTPVGILILFMFLGFGFGINEYVRCENALLSDMGRESDLK